METEGKRITLKSLYCPNKDSSEFYISVSDTIENLNNQSFIITGDYNLVQNQNLDTNNYRNVNNPNAKSGSFRYNIKLWFNRFL